VRGCFGSKPDGREAKPKTAPLYLIHTNNSPNPVSMRVPAVFEADSGLSFVRRKEVLGVMVGPLGFLIYRRSYGTKSTG
jgi:hypothetical protein